MTPVISTVLVLTVVSTISIICLLILYIKFSGLKDTFNELSAELEVERGRYDRLFHQKKSSEVRVGRIGENIAPFLDGWPYDSNDFRFLGNPIDGVQFNEDEIIFIEIKTGKAQLSTKQRWIKRLIKEGKISFATFRINENGIKFIKEENFED